MTTTQTMKPELGDRVIFTDDEGVKHAAFVQAVGDDPQVTCRVAVPRAAGWTFSDAKRADSPDERGAWVALVSVPTQESLFALIEATNLIDSDIGALKSRVAVLEHNVQALGAPAPSSPAPAAPQPSPGEGGGA